MTSYQRLHTIEESAKNKIGKTQTSKGNDEENYRWGSRVLEKEGLTSTTPQPDKISIKSKSSLLIKFFLKKKKKKDITIRIFWAF